MAGELDALNAAVDKLIHAVDDELAKPVITGVDPVAVQSAADRVSAQADRLTAKP